MIFSYLLNMQSHPSWVCGLKLISAWKTGRRTFVTPFVGVWIETISSAWDQSCIAVTPFVGVWIETWTISSSCMKIRVTSFVCVWIETPLPYHLFLRLPSHTLRGCVEWNRKQILFSEPTLKSHFYENVPLIVNKLQRQKIWFGTFLSGLSLVLYRNL